MAPLLELRDFHVRRGSTPVVHGLSLAIEAGEVLVLAGRNGAGKTSLLEGIAGLHSTQGELRCAGRDLAGTSARQRLRAGIALCAEGRSLFSEMTVRDNLVLGGYLWRRAEAERRAQSFMTRFSLLAQRQAQKAGSMSGGEQQLLAVCRALMSNPRVLLLDEPTAGLAPRWREDIAGLVRSLVEPGEAAVVLVDDNLEFALGLADRIVGLSGGREAFRLSRADRPTPASILAGLLEFEQRASAVNGRVHV
ncbi:MAG TPA: ATP-binding cassette domain-containing protein [Thermoanaerobaculia bacterium]|nr:ATP-binding cassette domain-containing protein [Thermoanaerobaculia bacterium]